MNSGYDANGNPVVYASSPVNNANGGQKGTNTFCLLGFIFSFVFSILGLVFSIVGLNQIKKTKEDGKGFAIAGIVISAIEIVFTILIFIFYIFIFVVVATDDGSYYGDTEVACLYATCDYTCEDGEYCACEYVDDYGDTYGIYCYVDWDINEKDYSKGI